MQSAPTLTEPTSSPRQGVGARIARRIGGAVRQAFAVFSRPRCPRPEATAPTSRNPQTSQSRQRKPQAPPTPVAPEQTKGPGWFARCFSLPRRPRPVYRRRGQFRDAPFTPETCPGLTVEDCKLLNTPVEDCDPEFLRQLLIAFAHRLAAILPPGSGIPDAEALFGMLWGRLAAPLADAPPDETADDASDGQQQPTGQAPSRRPGGKPRQSSAPGDALDATPDSMVPPRPGRDRRRSPRRFRRRDFPSGNARRILPDAWQHPAVRRLCYASCAGPP